VDKNETKNETISNKSISSDDLHSTAQLKQSESLPAKPSRKPKVLAASLLLVVLCFAAGISGGLIASQIGNNSTIGSSHAQYAKDDGNKIVTENEQTIASVVDKVSPSVVSIITSTTSRNSAYAQAAAGTGMIVTKDGYVLTNKHVVNGANSVSIVTSDGKTYDDVRVVGTDPLNDIAFLKIADVSDLPAVTLGDSKTVRTGQTVIAIGNALGQYQNTVTSGIISGLGRPVVASDGASESESLSDLLQTDAAINSGNSGGPLLNATGQVIGINTAVAQDAQSIGFSIPIGAAKGALNNIIETGKLARAYVGVQYISITPEVKAEYDLPIAKGDYIKTERGSAVQKDSPADKAGLKDKDIIVKVNDQEVGPGKGVSTLIGEYRPGDKVTLTILRDNQKITKEVTLAAYTS
jgi:serine protease Do